MDTIAPPSPSAAPSRIILGIDPGTNLLGYGVISVAGRRVDMQAMGVIDLRRCTDIYTKLGRIYERVAGIIYAFHPDELAIEAPFFGKNVQSMLKLGRAQGVAIAAAISRNMPIHEYAPMQIKMAITGNGQSSKEQVAGILKRIMSINDKSMLPYLDATDALAAAYCHFLQTARPIPTFGRSVSWKDIIDRHSKRSGTTSSGKPALTVPQQKLAQALCKKS